MTSLPDSSAVSALWPSVAGTELKPLGEIPRTSNAMAIVLAVYWPPHAPAPGEAWSSISVSSASVIRPAIRAPTASNTSWMVMFRPL